MSIVGNDTIAADNITVKMENCSNNTMEGSTRASSPADSNSMSGESCSHGPPEKRTKKDPKSTQEQGGDEYTKKRARNNLAVKKSRDRSKQRIMETQNRVDQLTKENEDLQTKVTLLSKELNVLRALFTSGGFTLPCNVQIVGTTIHQHSEPAKAVYTTTHANGATVMGQNGKPVYSNLPRQHSKKESRVENHTSVIRTASANCPSIAHGVVATGI